MTKLTYIGVAWLFIASLTFVGCQKSVDDDLSSSTTDVLPIDGVMRFSTEVELTKVGVTTTTLDNFGVFVVSYESDDDYPFSYPYSYENVKVELIDGEWVSESDLAWESEDIKVTITAYSPYQTAYSPYQEETAIFSVQTDQSSEEGLIASDLISAKEHVTPSDPDTTNDIYYDVETKSVVVDMEHILSAFRLSINLSSDDFTITSNPISSVTISGTCISAYFDYEHASVDDEYNVQDIKLYASDYSISDDNTIATAVYEGIVIPQNVDDGDLIVTVIDNDGVGYRWVSSDDATFNDGDTTILELTIEK